MGIPVNDDVLSREYRKRIRGKILIGLYSRDVPYIICHPDYVSVVADLKNDDLCCLVPRDQTIHRLRRYGERPKNARGIALTVLGSGEARSAIGVPLLFFLKGGATV